jgi:hypothetical protein
VGGVKWQTWSKDERSGRWLVIGEGSEKEMRAKVSHMQETASRHGVELTLDALPEGETP